MSNEVRTGILALVAIALSLWGIKYIQGSNILSRNDVYYATYANVAGVQIGTPVRISGVTVGSVAERTIDFNTQDVKLTFKMAESVNLPKDTKAVLASTSVLGDMAVIFQYDKPCSGNGDCAQSGDTFEGKTLDFIESTLGEGGLEAVIQQLTSGLNESIKTLNDQLLGPDATGPIAETARDLQGTMQNMNAATGQLNSLLARSGPALERSLADVSTLLGTLEEQKASIAGILSNTENLSQQMVDAKLDQVIAEAKKTVGALNETIGVAQNALGSFNTIAGDIQAGKGSLGMLMKDQALYNNLNQLSHSLDSLSADFQERPYRYMPLKSRRKVLRFDRKDAAGE